MIKSAKLISSFKSTNHIFWCTSIVRNVNHSSSGLRLRPFSTKDAKESTASAPTTEAKKSTSMQIKGKSGVLSVTTTIEDSKLNEVVFEKLISNTTVNNAMASASDSPSKPPQKPPIKPKASDLESLAKIKRRSPYEQEPPITVYWRKDVEAKAIEVWGSRENLLRECLKREIERKKHQQNIFTVKRRLRDYRREIGSRTIMTDDEPGLKGKSGKVVLIAIGINALNFVFKSCTWLYTGSHSMFSEAIHSAADTINQLILAYGIHKSTQLADSDHPYGYSNMKYVSSLISGVGIFCVGTGLSVYHGITGLMHPEPIQDYFWAFFVLGGSLVSEGATLVVAFNEIKRSAKKHEMSFKEYEEKILV
uniref:Cation efflux protein transmembrane domain-containing protein n=1 Tax=Megaselia scalaris TaxID=36166 RepID=T1GUV0_MEGSC